MGKSKEKITLKKVTGEIEKRQKKEKPRYVGESTKGKKNIANRYGRNASTNPILTTIAHALQTHTILGVL